MRRIDQVLATLCRIGLVAVGLFAITPEGWSNDSRPPKKQPLKSGRAVGQLVPSFYVRAVTGPLSNKSVCYVCRNGERPVVMVILRRLDPETTKLLKALDKLIDKNRAMGLRGFAVWMHDDPKKVSPKLQTLSFNEKLALPLTVCTTVIAGASSQSVHRDAAVTVVLYRKQHVVARLAFRRGEVTKDAVSRVLKQTKKLLDETPD
jgi:hypothetical protein